MDVIYLENTRRHMLRRMTTHSLNPFHVQDLYCFIALLILTFVRHMSSLTIRFHAKER